MAEMVERVAAALAPFFSAADRAYGEPEKAARAVIEAMREPTEAMKDAAHDLDEDEIVAPIHDTKALLKLGGETLVWRTMIDAALAEQKTPA